MQLESLAIVFVFIGNAAAIILLAFMLFRILSQTEQTHEMMRGGTSDLVDAGKRLREMLQSVDRLSERLIDANKAAGGAQPFNISAESLNKLCALTESLTQENIQEHEQLMNDMRNLLESLQEVKPEGYSAWRHAHQGKLDQAVSQRSQLATELEQVKIRLEEANIVIHELRRANRLAEASTQSADVLRQNMDQQQQLLNRAKERAIKAELAAINLTQEMEKLSAEADKGRKETAADLDNLRAQMDVLNQERSVLFNQLEELKGVMKRTLLEKDFIEEKLLDLDEAHHPVDSKPASANLVTEPAG